MNEREFAGYAEVLHEDTARRNQQDAAEQSAIAIANAPAYGQTEMERFASAMWASAIS